MATNYPGSIDSLTNPSAGDALTSPSHSAQHANANDAIEAIETELGVNPSGSDATVAARLTAIEAGTNLATGAVTSAMIANGTITGADIASATITGSNLVNDTITATQIAANAVGSSELADNAVDTAAIQDGAVTSAKIADGTIATADLADGAVTYAKLGADVRIGNLLTANQASIETDASDWQAGVTNCTVTRTAEASGATGQHGGYALKLTCVGGGDASVQLPHGAITDIIPGETYTAEASFYSYPTPRSAVLFLQWFDAANAYLSGASGTVTTNTSTYTPATVVAVAPPGAVRANLALVIVGAGAEAHYVDRIGLWAGAGGQWAMPGQVIPGTSHIADNGAFQTSGTVAPEGVISAPPLSRYLQTSGAASATGAMEWVKATGTGNTGWVAGAEADTGWRSLDATALGVDTGKLTLTKCRLRRVGAQVFLSFYGTKVGTSGGVIATVPSGFRPADADETYGQIHNFTSKADAGIVNVQGSGLVNWDSASLTAGNVYINTLTFSVIDPWPSSLPGVAA